MPEYEAGTGGLAFVEEGVYRFEVIEAVEKDSNKGNPMIKLVLEVGDGTLVHDHLVFMRPSYWRIDQFRISTGEDISKGKINLEASDCLGRHGKVRLVVEVFDGVSRNKVGEYLPPPRKAKTVTTPAPTAKDLEREPDDIPF